ncbi:MAG: hypothetical protein Q7T73_09805 [Beijerinckiaceae bacterium]|nr:hypothetical protein [Beijerinckiaceae bacterium]
MDALEARRPPGPGFVQRVGGQIAMGIDPWSQPVGSDDGGHVVDLETAPAGLAHEFEAAGQVQHLDAVPAALQNAVQELFRIRGRDLRRG